MQDPENKRFYHLSEHELESDRWEGSKSMREDVHSSTGVEKGKTREYEGKQALKYQRGAKAECDACNGDILESREPEETTRLTT